jgi:hypothetical protein
MAYALDLAGWRSGALTALARVENDSIGKAQWVCRCDCGGAHIVRADNLKAKRVTRCLTCAPPARERVRIEAWYHLQLLATEFTGLPGVRDGCAGFAIAYRGDTELAQTEWIVGRVVKRQQPIVLSAAVRHFAAAGVIRCANDTPSVSGWIRRHEADIVRHSHNEGHEVWGAWHARTGVWRGPVDDADAMARTFTHM